MILAIITKFFPCTVAPHEGAWIEIRQAYCRCRGPWSHPTRVRGLKYDVIGSIARNFESHPTRVRGLKFFIDKDKAQQVAVAPHEGAWIEIFLRQAVGTLLIVAPHEGAWIEIRQAYCRCRGPWASHPTRVRGLKSHKPQAHSFIYQSHPTRVRGLKFDADKVEHANARVAPHEGAWIEIKTARTLDLIW